jgi:hypothetical protein
MRKLYILIIGLMMMFSLSSCETYTYATTQDDIYTETEIDIVRSNVSFDVIIQYGTPYYKDGSLLYYLYRDIYYYPFYYNNCWYVRAYRRPFTHFDRRPYFRPHRYDYRLRPRYYRGFNRFDRYHNRDFYNKVIPQIRHNRPNINKNQNNHNNLGGRR